MNLMNLIIFIHYITIIVGTAGCGLVIWLLITHRERIHIERLNNNADISNNKKSVRKFSLAFLMLKRRFYYDKQE